MQLGRTDYEEIISLIKKFEVKHNRKMHISELVLYIQAQRNIKLELAKQYVHDLAELGKIYVKFNGIEISEQKQSVKQREPVEG